MKSLLSFKSTPPGRLRLGSVGESVASEAHSRRSGGPPSPPFVFHPQGCVFPSAPDCGLGGPRLRWGEHPIALAKFLGPL